MSTVEIESVIRPEYLAFGKPNFSDAEIDAVTRVLRSGWIGMGPETIAFEDELANFVGAPYVITVNSCTSALFLSLLVHGVGPGDEVICPSMTWCSTANVALYLGAKPVFCDVDPNTFCVTAETLLSKVTPKTKAVMVVHMAGLAAEVDRIRAALPAHIAVIEDAAHAVGARFSNGSTVGSSGNLTCFSFYANKNLATGEGGAIALLDGEMAAKIRSLRLHGLPIDAWKRFSNPKNLLLSELTQLGYKMNFTDLQACIGRVQLARQDEFHTIRLDVAKHYYETLSSMQLSLQFQDSLCHPYHSRHLFLVLVPLDRMDMSRDDLILQLRERNIGASVHYVPLHQMPLYGDAPFESLPVTEDVCRRILTLPISSSMTTDDADYVCRNLAEIMRTAGK